MSGRVFLLFSFGGRCFFFLLILLREYLYENPKTSISMEVLVPASHLAYSQRPCVLFPTGLLKSKPLSTQINTWPQGAFSSVSVYHVVFCIFFLFWPWELLFFWVYPKGWKDACIIYLRYQEVFFLIVYLYARNGTRLFFVPSILAYHPPVSASTTYTRVLSWAT